MEFVNLLGSKLLNGTDSVKTEEVLKNKTAIGLYFSAHWCGPCRSFTPKLAEIYKAQAKSNNFEIVFVSSDKDDAAFKEYYKEMPWLALPYDDRKLKAELSKKYKVQGIPSFIILDGKGEVITKDGRSKVTMDAEFKNFPWKPVPVDKCLSNLLTSDNKVVSFEESGAKDKVLGLYFSAHWCGPCRSFTPDLVKYYKKMKELGKNFEIIFCSSDRDEKAFEDYFKDMPWLALPYAERSLKEELSNRFGVQGIPTFVILDTDFTVINTEGRGVITADKEGKNFPWYPQPVNPLSNPSGIQESPSFCFFLEGLEKKDDTLKAITTVAKKYLIKGQDPKYRFFTEEKASEVGASVRGLTEQTDTKGCFTILMDLDDNGAYYKMEESDITINTLTQCITDYEAKKLKRQQCKRQ